MEILRRVAIALFVSAWVLIAAAAFYYALSYQDPTMKMVWDEVERSEAVEPGEVLNNPQLSSPLRPDEWQLVIDAVDTNTGGVLVPGGGGFERRNKRGAIGGPEGKTDK